MSHIRNAYMEESPWINERYKEIGFVPSNIAHELVAIAEHQGSRAALGRLVPVNADCAELGGIYVLPEFRGLGISKEIVSYLLRQGMTYKKNSSRRLDRKFSGFTVFAGRRDSRDSASTRQRLSEAVRAFWGISTTGSPLYALSAKKSSQPRKRVFQQNRPF